MEINTIETCCFHLEEGEEGGSVSDFIVVKYVRLPAAFVNEYLIRFNIL